MIVGVVVWLQRLVKDADVKLLYDAVYRKKKFCASLKLKLKLYHCMKFKKFTSLKTWPFLKII